MLDYFSLIFIEMQNYCFKIYYKKNRERLRVAQNISTHVSNLPELSLFFLRGKALSAINFVQLKWKEVLEKPCLQLSVR